MKAVVALLTTLALTPAMAHAETPKPAPTLRVSVPAPVEVAPLAYEMRTLPNGLRVFSMPDKNTANVSVHVWYDVGSKDDPAARSGFAHLFEHLMFKATKNLVPEQFDRLTEDVGGFNNASTSDDWTNYYSVVPANHLERVLFAEADRMGSLVVKQDYFASERDVVKEEYRQGILAQPYGRLFGLYLVQTAYAVHPYGRPGIGSLEDLDAATIEDVRAFHAAFYRPDNAILVVSGNFDPAQLNRWVDKYFAPITKPARPIARVAAVEPERREARTYTAFEPNVPLPAIVAHYPVPSVLHADFPALVVLDAILSKGQSSRLYQSLVYEEQVAAEAFTVFQGAKDPSILALGAILSDGKTADEGLASLQRQVERLRSVPPTPAELAEAQNQLVAETLQGRETAFGRAYELAESVIVYGDPKRADTLLQDIQRVTAADVQRVARTWLRDDRRVAIRYMDESQQAGATEDVIASAKTIAAQTIDIPAAEIPLHEMASDEARVRPPEPGQPVSPTIPPIEERTLANGLRVIVATDPDLPLLSANLLVRAGAADDPEGRAGLASMTADLLTQGAGAKSATEFAAAVEALGADISASAGADSSSLTLTTISARADKAFALFADAALRPAFAPEELERQRRQALDGLSVSMRQPRSLASYTLTRALFGAGRYGDIVTPTTLEALQQTDVAAFHTAHFRPNQAVLVLSGDITPADGFALAQKYFGAWSGEGAAPQRSAASQLTAQFKGKTLVVDLPQSGQAAVTLGKVGPARTDADFFATLVANTVLGGGYSARLNQEIRIKRGLSYGAFAALPERLAAAPLYAATQTKNESAVEVVDLMAGEFGKLGAAPVGAEELKARKATLIGDFGRDVETTAGVAGQISSYALFGLPLRDLKRYAAQIEAVSASDVRTAGGKFFDPNDATLVVVGDAQIFFDELKRKRPNAERIPVDALKLDSDSLR